MFIQKTTRTFFLRQPYWEIAIGILIAFSTGYLLVHGYDFSLIILCLFSIFILVAYLAPILAVLTLISITILPIAFLMVTGYSDSWLNLSHGIRIDDMIVVSMLVAIFLKLLFPTNKKSSQNKLGLSLLIILLGLWMLFEIMRNMGMYGLSAPGEFRYRYLILVVPVYICFFFVKEKERKNLFKMLIVFTLFFPILCVPIIGHMKGWAVGADSRFFPSAISLGLLYGIVALGLGHKYNILRINGAFYWLLIVLVGLLILIDTHRSVWISAMAATITLFIMKEIPYRKIMTWLLLIIISMLVVYSFASKLIVSSTGITAVDFVLERSADIVKFGEGYDNTAAWRVVQWKMQMQKFYAAPITGEGFGGYWGLSGVKGDLGVSPHSLYVQTLVKLGVVGMFLYLIIILKIFDKLWRTIARYKTETVPEMAILIMGMVALITSHVFYLAYAFEYYSLLFIGLSAATLRNKMFGLNE